MKNLAKATILICFTFLTLLCLLHTNPIPLVSASSTVNTTTNNEGTLSSTQRKTFYAATRHWVFYFDFFTQNIAYCSSLDGLAWGAPILQYINASSGCGFSLFYNNSHVAYARTMGTISAPIYYRLGIPQSDGTISWVTSEQTAYSLVNRYPNFLTVAIDSSGYSWIGFRVYDGVDVHAWVTKSQWNNGSWSTQAGFPYTPTATPDAGEYFVTVLPQTNQNVYLLYQRRTGANLRGKQWYGGNSSWNAEETPTVLALASSGVSGYYSAVNQGNDIHVVFSQGTTYYLQYVTRTASTETWSTNTTIQASTTATSSPVLSINSFTNDLYCFWAGSPTANHVYYKKYASGSWDAATDWFLDNPLTANDRLTCSYQSYGDNNIFGLLYMANTSSPYTIRYAFLSITNAPTNDACTLSNPYNATHVLARWSTPYTYLVNVNDPDGFLHINYVDLRLEQPAGLYASVIVRYTEVNATFFIQAGSSYISLGSCSNTSSSTYSNLTFSVVFDWDYPLTSDIDAQVYTIDDSALSDTDTYNIDMNLITSLTTSPVTNDARQNVGGTVTISSFINYTSTTTQVPNAEISANGVVIHNSLHISQGTASATPYSISITLPAVAQLNVYHVYLNGAGDYVDGDIGSSVDVVSDSLSCYTSGPPQYQGNGAYYYQVQVQWTYDSLNIDNATLEADYPNGTIITTFNTNTTGWVSFVIDQTNSTNGVFTVYGVNDNNYSITVAGVNATFTLRSWVLETEDVDGNTLTSTTLALSIDATSVWSGSPRTLYIPSDTFNVSISWLQGLAVNTTANVVIGGDTTTNFNCTCYPFTVSATTYWVSSNATIATKTYSASLLVLTFSGGANPFTLVSSCTIRPSFILNVTYDLLTDFTPYGYLVLPHYGNITLSMSYESWGSTYVESTDQIIISSNLTGYKLYAVTTGTAGVNGVLKVYCGTRGNPPTTTGFVTTSYMGSTMTGNYVFASDKTLGLDWTSYGSSPGGPGGPSGPSGPSGLVASIAFGFPSFTTQGTELNGLLNITWTGYPTIYLWNVECDLPYKDWRVGMPTGLPFTLNMQNALGQISLNIVLFIPKNATVGNLQIPCTVTLSTSQGATKTIRTVITLDVAAPTVNIPYNMTFLFLIPLGAVVFFAIFRRSERKKRGY